MKITIAVGGEPQEVAVGLERMGRAIRNEFGLHSAGETSHPPEQQLNAEVLRKVWSRITQKARNAMRALWERPEGLTKEEIVEADSLLTNTRDLGGALSSIARVCKALKVPNNQQAIYGKHEAPDGRVLYQLTDTARELLTEFIS